MLISRVITASLLLLTLTQLGRIGAAGVALAQTSPADQLSQLAQYLDAAQAALAAGDVAGARAAYTAFDDGWFDIEDGIRAQSQTRYRAIEDAMAQAKFALRAEPGDVDRALAALQEVRAQTDAFTRGQAPADQQPLTAVPTEPVTLAGLLARLDQAQAYLDAGDPASAAAEVDTFRREWTSVEELVKTQSADVYRATEANMEQAYALLSQPGPDGDGARAALAQIKADLAPFAAEPAGRGPFNAIVTGLARPA